MEEESQLGAHSGRGLGPVETMIYDLRRPTYLTGDIVITLKGFKFELVESSSAGESWKDLQTGLIWLPQEDGRYDFHQAIEKFGDRLPTINEFELAELHGFREIVPFKNEWYWSSSVHPNFTDLAFIFNGGNGYVSYGSRNYNVFSVRCVSGR